MVCKYPVPRGIRQGREGTDCAKFAEIEMLVGGVPSPTRRRKVAAEGGVRARPRETVIKAEPKVD